MPSSSAVRPGKEIAMAAPAGKGAKRQRADGACFGATKGGIKKGPAPTGGNVNLVDENVLGIRRSGRERISVERYVPAAGKRATSRLRHPPRFHVTPANEWHWLVKKMNVAVRNTLEWRAGPENLPRPPVSCWLLPCKCDTAVEIAKYQHELRELGWKLLTCEPHVVSRIGQKANLHAYAKKLGLLEHLPQHYAKPESASYPCMLKASVGEHGRDVFIVKSAADAREKSRGGFSSGNWLLQELCKGRDEYATSLLVKNGEILDAIATSYVYDKEIYVWPDVEEDESKRRSTSDIPQEHLDIMKLFLSDFSGICNFNYKIRPDNGLCIFEVNARIGADLACDVPRRRAAAFFERLDELDVPVRKAAKGAASSSGAK